LLKGWSYLRPSSFSSRNIVFFDQKVLIKRFIRF
jgi:hypothetical protein